MNRSVNCCSARPRKLLGDNVDKEKERDGSGRESPASASTYNLPDDVWLECDDEVIRVLRMRELEDLLSRKPRASALTPYLLFYVQVNRWIWKLFQLNSSSTIGFDLCCVNRCAILKTDFIAFKYCRRFLLLSHRTVPWNKFTSRSGRNRVVKWISYGCPANDDIPHVPALRRCSAKTNNKKIIYL